MLSWYLQIATLALGVAASPLPIVAVIVILLTKRARVASIVLLVSWVVGVTLMLGISIAFAESLRVPARGTDLAWEGVFTALLGVGLVVAGVLSRRGRLRSGSPEAPPAWVSAVDNLSPAGGAFVVFTNATTSPKNIALAITAGKLFGSPPKPIIERGSAVLLYVAIASITIALPVGLYLFGGERSVAKLEQWKRAVTANAAVVMEITLLVLGLGLAARGIYNVLS